MKIGLFFSRTEAQRRQFDGLSNEAEIVVLLRFAASVRVLPPSPCLGGFRPWRNCRRTEKDREIFARSLC
jgi:hypothetical protein